MTYLRNTFTGQTSGTTATASNSGTSGSPFSHINKSGGGLVDYINQAGDMVLRITNGTAETFARYSRDGTDGRRVVLRRDVTVPSLPTATSVLGRIARDDGSSTLLAHLSINATGKFVLFQGATALNTSTYSAVAGGHYWFELAFTASTAPGVTDGVTEYRVWEDGGTLVASHSAVTSVATVPNIIRAGGVLSTAGWTYDTMTVVTALFTNELDAWIGSVPWLDVQQLHVTADAPGIAQVGSGYNTLSPAATSYTWTKTAGPAVQTMTDGPSMGVGLTGADQGTSHAWSVSATNASGTSRTRTVYLDVAPASLLVCDGATWRVADAATLAVIALLPGGGP